MDPSPVSTPTTAAVAAPVPAPTTATTILNYPDSIDSSPRSRKTDSWDEPPYRPTATAAVAANTKLRLMCSYGGHIIPRPQDKSLCYVGGDTRIIVIDRHTTLSDLHLRLSRTLLSGKSFSIKYQLPNEDLDSLISISTDEDLENMVDEYDRLLNPATNPTTKTSRLRLFIFPSNLDSETLSSVESLLENRSKSNEWFFNALNCNTTASCKVVRGFSETSSVNCLLGLDDNAVENHHSAVVKDVVEAQSEASPVLETMSSFGSTSSSPSMANSPPIRVHAEEGNSQKGVVDMNVQKQEDGGFVVGVGTLPAPVASGPVVVGGEYPNRDFSDDEKSEQGVAIWFRKAPQVQPQQQQVPQLQQQQQATQFQHNKPIGVVDLPSPDSVSSDGSVTNPLSRQKPMMYHEPFFQVQSGNGRVSPNQFDPKTSDSNSRVQAPQQVQDSGYASPGQFDQYQQLHQPQQFVPANTQYIHHHPPGAVPMYYYPPQQLGHAPGLEHQYPVYFMTARQPQAYNLPVQQPSYSESTTPAAPSSQPQTPPAAMVPPTAFNPATNGTTPKPEMATGVYRTSAAAAPHLVQVPSSQTPQYAGYSQIHHPSQSIAPSSASTANYAYEFADPAHAQVYYTQPLAHQLAAQYQTMTLTPQVKLPEASTQVPRESIKQQVRTTQL
ncbi:hypothetical protein ACH5RR_030109 [Cinchona calisaya]|uniref:PB1 domain-containing protein n=1 Tax=Cinchona calisaya TaxID=153742 RepID=A0ABD2YYW3_9GENT